MVKELGKNKVILMIIFFIIYNLGIPNNIGLNQNNVNASCSEILKEEIFQFVSKINIEYINHNENAIFVVKVFNYDTTKNECCFTLGYILNSSEYNDISPSHFSICDSNYVIYNFIEENYIFDTDINDINDIDRKNIEKILFPISEGGITYTAQNLYYSKIGKTIVKTFYENEDEVPFEKSIYYIPVMNYEIEQIKEGSE